MTSLLSCFFWVVWPCPPEKTAPWSLWKCWWWWGRWAVGGFSAIPRDGDKLDFNEGTMGQTSTGSKNLYFVYYYTSLHKYLRGPRILPFARPLLRPRGPFSVHSFSRRCGSEWSFRRGVARSESIRQRAGRPEPARPTGEKGRDHPRKIGPEILNFGGSGNCSGQQVWSWPFKF